MEKATCNLAIAYKGGGKGDIVAVVEYDGQKIKNEEEVKYYEEFLKSVIGRIATAVGKAEDIGFGVTTKFPKQPEKVFRYGGEKLTITITGDNPACHALIKRRIEKVYGAHRCAEDLADLADQFIGTTKDVCHGFMICVRRFIKDEWFHQELPTRKAACIHMRLSSYIKKFLIIQ